MMTPHEMEPWMEAAIKVAEEFLSEIVRPPAKELGELLADQVRWFRYKNQIRIIKKARDKLMESGISPGKVPLKILVPLLDSGSLEEEESMIDRWANLLANAVNPSRSSDIKTAYIEVLNQLTPIDSLILDKFYDYHQEIFAEEKQPSTQPLQELDAIKLKEISGVEQEAFERSMDNLMRLDLVTTPGALLTKPRLGEPFYAEPGSVKIQFTRFGYSFVLACTVKN